MNYLRACALEVGIGVRPSEKEVKLGVRDEQMDFGTLRTFVSMPIPLYLVLILMLSGDVINTTISIFNT